MIRNVLLAYDGTLEGAMALREGALLARTCRARVHLLSVVPITGGVQLAESIHGGVVGQLVATARPLFQRAVTRLRQLRFDPIARFMVGDPAPTIGGMARELGVDLVVARHNPQSLLSRWWDGSTDVQLSRHVGCSLMLTGADFSDAEWEAELCRADPEG
jgi:nucleotide-binding universal stress UspA family protein